ncbi:response regulator [Streptomyces sp. ISL-10]|uniref:response regulator n=1 Tax=Streptomyces sp. ISL-10 TaxID=2819172 RepID=UPI001BE57D1A|nr:response regulator [Streptomyces sp. ISL-10]MBT2366822.1 response regulator [Streptomyces sp. ISL-10]
MTGLQTLILTIVLLVLVCSLLFFRGGNARISMAQLIDLEIKVGEKNRNEAKKAIVKAAEQRGDRDVQPVLQEIEQTKTARVARVLWVDDNPDNNLYETLALEQLGLLVTKATSTDAGMFYFNNLDFSFVVTDVHRESDADAGMTLLKELQRVKPEIPVIAYTMGAAEIRDQFINAGARAVVDTPAGLIHAALNERASAP